MKKQFGMVTTAAVVAMMLSPLAFVVSPAHAVPADNATAKGRAVGSGKWGYVGQFGKLNKTSVPQQGDFLFPYGIDISGDTVAVTDSGVASWDTGSKDPGHSVQTFKITAEPGAAGHGDYLGGGMYDIVNTKSTVLDPHSIVAPTAIDYLSIGAPRGPRGVAFDSDGSVVASTYEASTPSSASLQIRKYASARLESSPATWGSADFRVTGAAPGPVAVDTDAQGNVYVGTNMGVSVYSADGTFRSSVDSYFDENGENQTARVQWATRAIDVPREYVKPDLIGETYGLSVTDMNGQTAVYVGDAGSYYQPDYLVHFPGGSSTAQFTKPASIKKYILTQSGGIADARWNPSAWRWTLDTSFGINGAVQFPGNSLLNLFGKPYFTAQAVFALEADPTSGVLYYALNGVQGKKIGAVDLTTGAEIDNTPAPVNMPGTQDDSAMNYVRGIAVDQRGLLYATTQASTSTSNARAIVQVWGKTPTSIAGTAHATAQVHSASLAWNESTVGYQQPDLLDYVIKYRRVGDPTWITAPAPGGATTSTALTRDITGLAADTDYEAMITPFNEAGSGDPAVVSWRTPAVQAAVSLKKTGKGVTAADASSAVNVAADSDVTFEYIITNTGNVPVGTLSLTDSEIGAVRLPTSFGGTLDPGESVTAEATGPVAPGQYANSASVTGAAIEDSSLTATASAEWHGFGVTTGLSIVKKGNGQAATTPGAAVKVPAGTDVAFTYTVTNTGNAPVTQVAVTDDKLAILTPTASDSSFDGSLQPGQSVTFEATGPVGTGDYKNTAVVTARVPTLGSDISATTDWYAIGTDTTVPTTSPTPPSTTPTQSPAGPSTSPTPHDSGSTTSPPSTTPETTLSVTGSDSSGAILTGISVLTLGCAVLVLRRRQAKLHTLDQ